MYKSIYVYPWDVADETAETVLERIRPLGINTITLAVAYHAGKFLRPHGRSGKVYFPRDGSVYFRARSERYGRIKPLVHPDIDNLDVLPEIDRKAPELARVAWIAGLHNTSLGELHPECTTRNAFGDPYVYSLCPTHPDVREYLIALCRDVADRYALTGIALETPGWLPFEHGYHHEFTMVRLNRWAKTLLALCFSDSTRNAARERGIDADRLRMHAREWLERYFDAELDVSDEMAVEWSFADMVSDAEWGAFFRFREQWVAELVADVKAALPRQTELYVIPTVQRPTASSWIEGSDCTLLAGACDALEIPAYEASAKDVLNDAWDVRRRVGRDTRLRFILRPSYPDLRGGAETVEAVRGLAASQIDGIAFYNYGHLRLQSLERIRQALAVLES